ncbi:hypothetical protein [Reichenbachiella versicolor]|uniref:hypothetical protein n=1 Tax=Reichenbachiella versicolor TaxID=1821036 RepID=UPI000D6E96AD|nr:hypothetical protein [Reichenbachiella versicolor]
MNTESFIEKLLELYSRLTFYNMFFRNLPDHEKHYLECEKRLAECEAELLSYVPDAISHEINEMQNV